MMDRNDSIGRFVEDQLASWPLAGTNFGALGNVETRELVVGGLAVRAQFNPARIISSAANTDRKALQARPCFLCRENRPKEQMHIPFRGRSGNEYDILVNPYPIFPEHLVVAAAGHCDQGIAGRYPDILDLSAAYPGRTFFYNGPKCGASAPDHHHFQAAGNGMMPLEADVDALLERRHDNRDEVLETMVAARNSVLFHYRKYVRGVFVIASDSVGESVALLDRLLGCAEVQEGDVEPRFNMISWYRSGEYRTVVIFRTRHRSHHYWSEGPDHLTMSPGCADMGGLLIVPKPEDYAKLDSSLASEMLSEVTLDERREADIISGLTRSQHTLSVGVLSAREIGFEILSGGGETCWASWRDGRIEYGGSLHDELVFRPETGLTLFAQPSFILHDVVIGKGFHWERKENQTFAGTLRIIVDGDRLTAINDIGVEDYLLSVISSEMSAGSSLEFLKAHAVISRSWAMSQIGAGRKNPDHAEPDAASLDSSDEIVRWYDHEDHVLFDVCADDHCQRYQGLTRATGENVRRAIEQTWGQVLTFGGDICDARFSKCCGGMMERFSSCWEDKDFPYLAALPDTPDHDPDARAFCDTDDPRILGQVLNSYDRETADFFEWTETLDKSWISENIERRTGRRIGRLISLRPLLRGASGRVTKLAVEGSESSFTIGKELEIRRLLSSSHLKSSAFEVEDAGERVILHGRGWGHGVGLCQIGAAVMASEGYDYRSILLHYYPGTEICRR